MPKLHDKEIVRLDPNEVAILLDQVEDGTKMTKSQMKFHDKTKVRDLALLTLCWEPVFVCRSVSVWISAT